MLGHERCRPWVHVAGQDRAWWLVPVGRNGQPWAWARPVRVLSRRSGAGVYQAARPSRWAAFACCAAAGRLAAAASDSTSMRRIGREHLLIPAVRCAPAGFGPEGSLIAAIPFI